MIDIRTVLVLGAGASHPYGFELGYDLWKKASTKGTTRIHEILQHGESKTADLLEEFRRLLLGSQCESIDAFLESRPKYEKVGKAVIAYYLIRREKEETLFGSKREDDWYRYLLNDLMLTDGFEGFGHNKLSVITFNYDRSLEHYILSVLQNRYGKSRDDCLEALSQIPIIHVHGKLGELSANDIDGRQYENSVDVRSLRFAMEGIRIAHDKTLDTDPDFVKARSELCGATHVIFLGFGYLKANLKRLNLRENRREKVTKCFGTAVGLKWSEIEFILDLFPRVPEPHPTQPIMEFNTEAVSCRDFIRNNLRLFRKR